MCYRQGCRASNIHPLNTANPNLNICQAHLEEVARLISEACPRLPGNSALDYAKIWAIVMDEGTLDAAMTYLGDQLAQFAADAERIDAIAIDEMPVLHFLLKSYEEKFGFGRDCLLTGILSGEAFLEQLTEAYSTCDFGADADHGAFTHRLQWFAIMYAATGGAPQNGSEGNEGLQNAWSTPIVNLYKMLGDNRTAERVGLPRAHGNLEFGSSLWAVLFDLADMGGYNHPDKFHLAIRTQRIGGPQLSAAVLDIQREVVKRRLRVLNCLQMIGAVAIGNRYAANGASEKISEREDLINRAIVGGNLVSMMRYRDVQVNELPSGEFKSYTSEPTGNFFAGEGSFGQRVSNVAVKNLARSLIQGGRWEERYDNLLVRRQRMNSRGEIVGV